MFFVWNISHFEQNWERNDNKRVVIFKYNTVQYSTVQYTTLQYSTAQHSTVQFSTAQYSTVQYSTAQYSTVQYLLFLSDFNENWIFWTDLPKIRKYQISWKSFQWESSCSMQTDMTKLTVAFRSFADAPKKRCKAPT